MTATRSAAADVTTDRRPRHAGSAERPFTRRTRRVERDRETVSCDAEESRRDADMIDDVVDRWCGIEKVFW